MPAGHCGPEGVGLDDGEEEVIVDCIEIAVVVGTEDAGEDVPVIVPPGEEVASEETEEVDCPDSKMPTTYPVVPAMGACGKGLR